MGPDPRSFLLDSQPSDSRQGKPDNGVHPPMLDNSATERYEEATIPTAPASRSVGRAGRPDVPELTIEHRR
jgi:hypothetical protein